MVKSWKISTADSTDPRHNLLKNAMDEIRKENNKATLSIWASISASLIQYKLEDIYTVEYILQRSFQAGLQVLDQGKPIENPTAWLRRTSFQLVRELHNDQ